MGFDVLKFVNYYCVFVCVDVFIKWVEVVFLRRYDVKSVVDVFITICCRWGSLEVVRLDNGSEFRNVIVDVLFEKFGVKVRIGVVYYL